MRTLGNAVRQGKVHHAYLFVGSRGTGKTSSAKILAACLNCERGRTVQPCGVCESCVAIAQARSMEVIEMDAASNNSVEDIRELRESVALAPLAGRAKVYILDEAHMLSTAAWNAFLKTLEEPPPNTVFVLATTEAEKVPATVVDRCHRFDFQRPTVEQVSTVLDRTAEAEAITIPAEATAALAKAAGGSFRDALGTLEQLVTYGGQQISLADVLAVLGLAGSEQLEETLDAVAAGDAAAVLGAVERCVAAGREVSLFTSELERRTRELTVVQILGRVPSELSLTADADARLLAQAGRISAPALVRLLDLLAVAMQTVRAGGDARTQLELALLKAARPELDPTLKALQARVERLEAGAGVTAAPASAESVQQARPGGSLEATAAGAEADGGPPDSRGGEALAAAPPSRPAEPGSIEAIRDAWPAIVESIRSRNALLGAVIEDAQPQRLSDGELVLAFPSSASFSRKKADTAANRAEVGEAVRALTGTRASLLYELREQEEAEEAGEADEEDMVRMVIRELDAEELPAEEEARERSAETREGH